MSQKKTLKNLRITYLAWIIIGLFSLVYVPSKIFVEGNAAATTANILNNTALFNLGILGSLITQLLFIVAVLLLYKLLNNVNKKHSILMVVFALIGISIAMLNELNNIAALIISKAPGYLSSFEPSQLQSLAMLFLNLNQQGIIIASIFLGLWLFPLGYLIYKSGYFPKAIGIAVIIGGFGYVLSSFAHFIIPNSKTLMTIFEAMTFGEVIFVLWLLIKGAKIPKKNPK
jgi:hypothetical protein